MIAANAGGFNQARRSLLANSLRYLTSPSGIVVDLWLGLARDGFGGTDIVRNFRAVVGSAHDDVILGSHRDETFEGGGGGDRLDGRDGGDFLLGEAGNDRVDGGRGDDTLRGGFDNDRVWGGPGNDGVFGDFGADTLRAGAGDDTVDGGIDDDLVFGGGGRDTFAFDLFGSGGLDTLADFAAGVDVIRLSQYSATNFADLDTNGDGALTAADENVTLSAGGDITVTLTNDLGQENDGFLVRGFASLAGSDFVFA